MSNESGSREKFIPFPLILSKVRAVRFIGIFTLCCLLSACGKKTQVEQANEDGILIVGNAAEPKSLDPHIVTGVPESKVITSLFEGLVADHPSKDDEMAPGAASSWEHNETFTEWTFHLNPKAQWSDKIPVTAHDFVFSYHRMLHPDIAAPYAEMLYFIEGAEAFNRGGNTDFSSVGVTAVDDFTLFIKLREPTPFLPSITRHYTWFPVPKHVVTNPKFFDKSPFESFTEWSKFGNLVGNGPFQLKSWVFGGHIEVERNPYYWDAENVGLNGIRFLAIGNFYTESRAFLAGQLHTTYRLPADMVERIKKKYPQYLKEEPYVGTVFFRLNTTKKPLNLQPVREAMALAIDRDQLCKYIYTGYTPTTSYVPKMGHYLAPPSLTFDPERAKKLLAEAGFPNGKGFPRLSILISNPDARSSAEAMQAMWRQNLDIIVDIKNLDWGSYITAQQSLEYDIAVAGWIGDYLDPTTFLGIFTKGNGNNNTGWSSPKYEKLLTDAAHKPDPTERLKTLAQAEQLFMSEYPIIPVAWYSRIYLHRPEVKGWFPLLLDNHPWKTISLESK